MSRLTVTGTTNSQFTFAVPNARLQIVAAETNQQNVTFSGATSALTFSGESDGVLEVYTCLQYPAVTALASLSGRVAVHTPTNCSYSDVYNACASGPCVDPVWLDAGAYSRGPRTLRCDDRERDYVCTCLPGFSGVNCQTDINECASAPCMNGGTCTDRVNGYNCTVLLRHGTALPQHSTAHCTATHSALQRTAAQSLTALQRIAVPHCSALPRIAAVRNARHSKA